MRKLFVLSLTIGMMLVLLVGTVQAQGSVNGGGQLIEAPDGAKRPEWNVISFGGWVEGEVGEWQVNFHNVGDDALDKSSFHGTDIREVNYFNGGNKCDAAMNLTVVGAWNSIPGYKVILRAGDSGAPGTLDTFRVTMYEPGGAVVYDTYPSEFTPESDCVGTARTGLDAGNVTIVLP